MSEKKSEDNKLKAEYLKHEDQVQHLLTGYQNAQEITRFLDTKAALVIGTVPVIIGTLVGIVGFTKDNAQYHNTLCSMPYILVLYIIVMSMIAIFGVFQGIISIHYAFNSVLPQDSGKSPPSILFPYENTNNDDENKFSTRVDVFTKTPSQSDVIEDYKRQLVRMSQILPKKLQNVNESIKCLKRFIYTSILIVITLFIGPVYCGLQGMLKCDANRNPATLPSQP